MWIIRWLVNSWLHRSLRRAWRPLSSVRSPARARRAPCVLGCLALLLGVSVCACDREALGDLYSRSVNPDGTYECRVYYDSSLLYGAVVLKNLRIGREKHIAYSGGGGPIVARWIDARELMLSYTRRSMIRCCETEIEWATGHGGVEVIYIDLVTHEWTYEK
jgi:hypothetical protein